MILPRANTGAIKGGCDKVLVNAACWRHQDKCLPCTQKDQRAVCAALKRTNTCVYTVILNEAPTANQSYQELRWLEIARDSPWSSSRCEASVVGMIEGCVHPDLA